MSGHLSHCCGRANPQALRANLDAVVEKASKADKLLGPAHIFLEELHHVGTAGDVFGGGIIAAGLGAQGKCRWSAEPTLTLSQGQEQ